VASVNELLKLGRWPDKPDSRGMTPLMVAAEMGDLKIAEVLLRGGATARPAIRVAEQRADAEMLRLLKRYAGR
jgi:ankyrin repeat protein